MLFHMTFYIRQNLGDLEDATQRAMFFTVKLNSGQENKANSRGEDLFSQHSRHSSFSRHSGASIASSKRMVLEAQAKL